FRDLIERYEREHDVPAVDIAAALAHLAHGGKPLLLEGSDPAPAPPREHAAHHDKPARGYQRQPDRRRPAPRHERPHRGEPGKNTYRLEVGHAHHVKPGNIIGAIANEAGLDSQYIGRLTIRDDHSLVDLPEGMPHELLQHLKKVH